MTMKRCLTAISFIILLPTFVYATGYDTLFSAKEMLTALLAETSTNQSFSVTATVSVIKNEIIYIKDSSGSMYASLPPGKKPNVKISSGDKVHLTGTITLTDLKKTIAICDNITHIGTDEPPKPEVAAGTDIANGKYDFCYIQLVGVVRDTFRDDIDSRFAYTIVNSDGHDVLISNSILCAPYQTLRDLIGSTIKVVGICDPRPLMRRYKVGHIIHASSGFSIIAKSKSNIFCAPDLLSSKDRFDPGRLASCDRMKVHGKVLAIWDKNNVLLGVEGKVRPEVIKISLIEEPPPKCGDMIEAVGFPGTDTYEHTLRRAFWRPSEKSIDFSPSEPVCTSIRNLKTDPKGRQCFHPFLIYKRVTIRGRAKTVPDPRHSSLLLFDDNGLTISGDASSCPQVLRAELNWCEIEMTGYVIPVIDDWSTNNTFPEIKDLLVAIQSPDDIVIVARPPWWTPFRLFVAILILVIVIVGIVFWNAMLRRLAERRGRELAAETVSHAEANMRTFERTRLAVELHDALSQNLTGVAMRIQAAEQYADGTSPELTENLNIAERTLKSCRTELKNCLWDLRSQALEEATIDGAIRLTLKPYLSNVSLALRFNVPRSRVTDNTMHTLLRIIRELAVNGIRHGHASEIKIAGSIEDNVLKFSVADNGCGFDPNLCPSVDQGHFGLEGIRERIRLMSGTMTVSSQPGQGSKTTIALHMPKEC